MSLIHFVQIIERSHIRWTNLKLQNNGQDSAFAQLCITILISFWLQYIYKFILVSPHSKIYIESTITAFQTEILQTTFYSTLN